jgi:integrase
MQQARSARDHAPIKAAVSAQLAVAIAILTFAPVRLRNLVSIELGQNLIKPGGLNTPYWLVFPHYDVKNRVDLNFKFDQPLSDLIDEYIHEFRPTLLRGANGPWLEIGKDLALVAFPRSKFDRLVLTEVLLKAGLTLIQEAENSPKMTKLACANQARNGLMLALLALCPIRRKNFVALEIRGKWWIVLSADETKERRADERPINELLTVFIDRYISDHRPVLARSHRASSILWLSSRKGTPISDKAVAHVIRQTTLSTVGVAVGPHLFRTSGASSAAILGGENPNLGSALLHHTHPSVTNAHYNRATSLSAGESLRQIVRQYQKQ